MTIHQENQKRALELANRIAAALREYEDIEEAMVYQYAAAEEATIFVSIPGPPGKETIRFGVHVRPDTRF